MNGIRAFLKGFEGVDPLSSVLLPCEDLVFVLSGGCSTRHLLEAEHSTQRIQNLLAP